MCSKGHVGKVNGLDLYKLGEHQLSKKQNGGAVPPPGRQKINTLYSRRHNFGIIPWNEFLD
jgi:hypothetical protein